MTKFFLPPVLFFQLTLWKKEDTSKHYFDRTKKRGSGARQGWDKILAIQLLRLRFLIYEELIVTVMIVLTIEPQGSWCQAFIYII